MKNLKRVQFWIVLLVVLLVLAACGGSADETVEDSGDTDTTSSAEEEVESEVIDNDDIGATGSEADSGELPPTPNTGNKAEAARATPYVITSSDTAVITPSPASRIEPDLANAARQLDIVFLLDASGSMAKELETLKASLDPIGDSLTTLPDNVNLRFGLVVYRDKDQNNSVQVSGLTDRWTEVTEFVTAVTAVGGGDYPENLIEGLYQAITQINWTPEADRLLILLGDAPPYSNNPDDISLNEAIHLATAQNITVFSIGSDGLNAYGVEVFQQIAQSSNGRFVYISDNTETAPPNVATVQPVNSLSTVLLDIVLEALDEEVP